MSEPQTLGSASSHSGNGDRPKQPDARYIGIDLGTTYCAMAWLDSHGHPVTLPNSEDEPTTPSVVLFEPSGEVIVGREAKRAALVVPELVADHVKRDMGLPQYHKRLNYRYYLNRMPRSASARLPAR